MLTDTYQLEEQRNVDGVKLAIAPVERHHIAYYTDDTGKKNWIPEFYVLDAREVGVKHRIDQIITNTLAEDGVTEVVVRHRGGVVKESDTRSFAIIGLALKRHGFWTVKARMPK